MTNPFTAKPPLPVWKRGGLVKYIKDVFIGSVRILCQVFVPYGSRPEEPRELPDSARQPEDGQLGLCQAIFDQSEERRLHLEQKAQAMFSLIIFLVPLLGSIFVFIYKESLPSTVSRDVAIGFLLVSAGLLVLAFVSVMRAVSVKARDALFLEAVIDKNTGEFRQYDKAFHAQGLLYCASVNTAMNDHIAQFVKGGQILTGAAAIVMLAASIPAGKAFSDLSPSPTKTEIVGAVKVSSPELADIQGDISRLLATLESLPGSEERGATDARIGRVEDGLRLLQQKLATHKHAYLLNERRAGCGN